MKWFKVIMYYPDYPDNGEYHFICFSYLKVAKAIDNVQFNSLLGRVWTLYVPADEFELKAVKGF